MTGTCGTCGRDAEATPSNEGYSDCCNDRIAYDAEAIEIKMWFELIDRGWHWRPDGKSMFEPEVTCKWVAPNGTWVRGELAAIVKAVRASDPMIVALERV